MPVNRLLNIVDIILDETSPSNVLKGALDEFSNLCRDVTGVIPDPTYSAWAEDSFLDSGVAINPQAAAFCIKDYQRSIIFIRGVYAAIKEIQRRFVSTPVSILYAGCGPFATLLLPLLVKFKPYELDIFLLDIHQCSLDSVQLLINYFELGQHKICLRQGDACYYQHHLELSLIIAETMQKSLEQEPQFAVTANLAPQLCTKGIFIPEKIDVQLCLAHLKNEKAEFERLGQINHRERVASGRRYPLGMLLSLDPKTVQTLQHEAKYNNATSKKELAPVIVQIPVINKLTSFDALLLTHIRVFDRFQLKDYECEITLPQKCQELSVLKEGARYWVRYQLGNYPRFCFSELNAYQNQAFYL